MLHYSNVSNDIHICSWFTNLKLDSSKEDQVQVNFNITMLDLRCDWTVVDTVSVLGTEQNITSHVTKWHVDGEGIRRHFQGRNKFQHTIKLFDDSITESIEELLDDGEDAISLDETTYNYALTENEYVFVDYYASWCSHVRSFQVYLYSNLAQRSHLGTLQCLDLAPTWETLAEVMDAAAEEIVLSNAHESKESWTDEEFNHAKNLEKPVMIAKIDCVTHLTLCQSENIRAYPTLRLFIDGKTFEDYRGHRTIIEIVDWLNSKEEDHKKALGVDATVTQYAQEAAKKRMEASAEEKEWATKVNHHKIKNNIREWNQEEHPGCQVSGWIMVDRVPGNFHIKARSNHHDLVPHMTNVSHIVHHLSIGEPMVHRLLGNKDVAAPDELLKKLAPMNNFAFVTHGLHEAFHHYLKIITTDVDGLSSRARKKKAFQIMRNSQLAMYANDVVPEAKFMYDLSPISVEYKKKGRHWYDYLTSLMAIVGGTFTVVGMLEAGIHAAVQKSKRTAS
jgi:thiol-disulfide isomerase/thioredoxin